MVIRPDEFAATCDPGNPDSKARLTAALESAREERGCHSGWGKLCEELGQDGLALTEYQLALRDDPDDDHALARLTVLYRERGEVGRALECAERRFKARAADPAALRELIDLYLESDMQEQADAAIDRAREAGAPADAVAALIAMVRAARRAAPEVEDDEKVASTLVPSDSDVARFTHLFSGRENVYARQWWNESGEGGYTPVHQPLVFQVARNHLLGSLTVGVYPVRLDNTVTFCALDIDINKRALARARGSIQEARRIKEAVSSEARRLQSALAELGVCALLEDSGYKGRHLWIFFLEPVEAAVARQFGTLFLAAYPLQSVDLHCEFFPKQASTGSGIGNLIKLPLGIHRRTGRRSRLLLPDGSADPDPFGTLREIRKVPRDKLYDVIVALKSRAAAPPPQSPAPWEGEEAPPVPAAPRPPAPPPAWTAADFDTQPEIAHLFRRCAVLAHLKKKVEDHRRLTHDEQVVLMHSLGHSNPGVLAVNYLFDACVDVPAESRLKTPLSGNPISCPKIRKRIPHVTGQVDCHCSFDYAPDRYPTPRLHLLTLAKPGAPAERETASWDPAERTRALGVLRVRRARIEREVLELEHSLYSYMESAGLDRIEIEEGSLVLKHEPGAPPALEWIPKPQEDKAECAPEG